MTKIMESKPNNLATFDMLMELGHVLNQKTGKEYIVQIDWKNDCVNLFVKK